LLPSLVATYGLHVGGCVEVFIGEGPWETVLGLLLQTLGRVQAVVYDDIDYQPGFQPISGLRRRLIGALEQFAIRRADLVISVGDRLARLRRSQGAEHVQVISNGVDVHGFSAACLARRMAGRQRPTLIYSGYLGAWAGVDLILDAAALAAPRVPSLRVILLGHGTPSDLAALRRGIADRGLNEVVEFRGEMAYKELPAQLAEADVGLAMFPPLELTQYAFPLKVVEYMAAGLPVLTTPDSEAADLVMRAGAGVVVPFDAIVAADAIANLLQDRVEYRRYSDNARTFSRAYDWKSLMAEYSAVLQQLLCVLR
jgi:glycosyltransferase involved in cell wall biosynthesis